MERTEPTSTAGFALWRMADGRERAESADHIEVLLVHPGGPFWAKKHDHAWSIPKGEFTVGDETAHAAARREFAEEMGRPAPFGEAIELSPFRAGRKRLHAFALQGDFDAESIRPDDQHRSMVELEWPPKSGRQQRFPEVDAAAWVQLSAAANWLHKGQRPLVDQLVSLMRATGVLTSADPNDPEG